MNLHPKTKEAYQLFHDCALAFADFEHNGIKIDIEYCKKQSNILSNRIKRLREKISLAKEIRVWKKIYKGKFNLESNKQLAELLFDHLGYECPDVTEKGNYSSSESTLQAVGAPFAENIVELKKLIKLKNTYLKNIINETINGFIHPFFNLHLARTYRSSSDSINFQNQPARDPYAKRIIRNAFLPRRNHCFGGLDYAGIEVNIATCYHKDPQMIADITDPTKDMHRDTAIECYMLEKDEWTKQTRYCGKNCFVFPQFYGDWFEACAKNLWENITKMNLTTRSGIPLKKHLKSQGIPNLKQYIKYIQKVEDAFWNKRYPVYNEWKKKTWKDYLKTGYVDFYTGFRCHELLAFNKLINRPIQGTAFHCLVWSAIELNKKAKEEEWITKWVGQIHDEMTGDFFGKELSYVLDESEKIMTKDIRKHWNWLILPLEVEAEVSPLNKSWYHKKEVKKGMECECGNDWGYQKVTDTFIFWECPVCGKKKET